MYKLYRVYRYALFLLDRFKYLIALAAITFAISTVVLYWAHPEQADAATRRSVSQIAFAVFELMFASEAAIPYPEGSVPSQIVFFALPVLNILGLAAAVAQFSQILFDRSLYNRAQAENADGHVILCGLGRLGREILRQLDARHHMKRRRDVVIVESDPSADALEDDLIRREPIIPVVNGNMTHAATLRDARVDRAAAVMLLTGDDTTNLEAALLARELNPAVRVVMRMSNKRVSDRLDAMLRRSLVRNFQLIDSVEGSAPKCLDLCQLRAGIESHPLCVREGAIPPDPAEASGHVVVCGLGRLGFGVVRMLKGHAPLVVIDNGERTHYDDDPVMTADPAVPMVRGDMTVKRVLQQAGVARAAVVLLMTPHDTANLEAALVAHEMNASARLVMRITNSRISQRLDRVLREAFGDTLRVIDPAEYSAPKFVEAIGLDDGGERNEVRTSPTLTAGPAEEATLTTNPV